MFIETIETESLGHLSYLVGSGRDCVVVDPRRDCDVYLARARARDVEIRYILETHRNEDYVIGSTALARRTSAPILHGAGLDFEYGQTAREGEELEVGEVRIRVLETPGHTPESLSFVIEDRSTGDSPLAVLTGDALFVGDVGRTDLTDDDREAARALHASLFEKLLPLGDHVIVLPAHGAGSVCGDAMADRSFSTMGYERRHNPALVEDREEFVKRKLAEEHYVPPYFRRMEALNLEGPPVLDDSVRPPRLSPDELAQRIGDGAVVVDVRSPEAYLGASIPESLSLPLPLIASYAGWLLSADARVVLVSEDREAVDEATRELARIGYERVEGYLDGGLKAWETSGRDIQRGLRGVDAPRLLKRLREEVPPPVVLDVRKSTEVAQARVDGSVAIYLGHLPQQMERLDRERPIVTFCDSGRRATVAASVLRQRGFDDVEVALGSLQAWQAIDAPLEEGG